MRVLTLGELFVVQDQLNEFTLPDWRQKLSANNFRLALLDEVAELLGSGRNFKWWKHGNDPDLWNEKVEVIDIVHFYTSMIMLTDTESCNPAMVLGATTPLTDIPMFNESGSWNADAFVSMTNYLLSHVPTPTVLNSLLVNFGMTQEEVAALYTAKAELNFIRQETGYKDGTYKKVIDGIEDNAKLEIIVNEFLLDKNQTLQDVKRMVRENFYTGIDS